jgi:hypothetical protein
MTNTEWLRERLLQNVLPVSTFSAKQAKESFNEFFTEDGTLSEVVGHAKARKLMGAFRYEQKEADGKSYDQKAREGKAKTYVQRAQEKFSLYQTTGNKEFLVDVFNYVLLEWARPCHPNAHFKATERHDND